MKIIFMKRLFEWQKRNNFSRKKVVICIKHRFHQWGQVRKMLVFSFVTPFHHWLIYAASDGTAWNWTIENRFLETKPLSGKKPLVCFQWTMSSKCTIDYKNVPYKLVFELFVIELFFICFFFYKRKLDYRGI